MEASLESDALEDRSVMAVASQVMCHSAHERIRRPVERHDNAHAHCVQPWRTLPEPERVAEFGALEEAREMCMVSPELPDFPGSVLGRLELNAAGAPLSRCFLPRAYEAASLRG